MHLQRGSSVAAISCDVSGLWYCF